MKFLLWTVLILSSHSVLAAFNEPLTIKQVAEDGINFVFLRREGDAPWNGITIKDPHTKTILYEARVLKCSPASCQGQVVKNHSGLKLRADEEYSHSYNEGPIQFEGKDLPPMEKPVEAPTLTPAPVVEAPKPVVVEPKPEPRPVVVEKPKEKPKPKEKKLLLPPKAVVSEDRRPVLYDRSAYLGYGSPVGPGFKLGYYKNLPSFMAGVNYSNISSVTNNVGIKGHLLSLAGSYTVYKLSPSVDLNLIAELGMAKANLDFSGVNPDGPLINKTTYFGAAGGEGKLNFERFSLGMKFGMSKTGFAKTYDGLLNQYANPYGTVLVFLEIGAYYRF